METDCSKRHKIDYETCTNLTEVSQQKCTICKVCSYFFGLFQEPTNESALDWTCIPKQGIWSQYFELLTNILN